MTEQRGQLWGASDAYERYMGRWSRKIAPRFLDWLQPATGAAWLDLGCGTGVLCEAIIASCAPGSVLGIDPSGAFVEAALAAVESDCFACAQGNSDAIDVEDGSVDYAVSGLVLNFIPDKPRAMEEIVRTLKPGGKAALYVWDYAGHMQIMRYFFDAAGELDPGARDFDDGIKAPICRPEPLRELFADADLSEVSVEAIDIPTAFDSFEDYWAPFLGGTGSAPKYYTSLAPERQRALKERVRRRIPTGPDGEVLLAARAWAVQGIKDGA